MPDTNAISQLSDRLPKPVRPLADLAYNYWWSWTSERVSLFRSIDPDLWQRCQHNPVALLRQVSSDRLWQMAEDPHYLTQLDRLAAQLDTYLRSDQTWANREVPEVSATHPIAYFCSEFGVHESLPIYCGGLGILAADFIKSASDLGVPVVGVGLLYRQGYFQQRLNRSGWQEADYVDTDIGQLPLCEACNEFAQPIRIKVNIGQRQVRARVWEARLGRNRLYLLDSYLEENEPSDRDITRHLQSGDPHVQLAQAMLMGIGGVRALQALGIEPSIYHINEVQPVPALLEVARQLQEQTGLAFEQVQAEVRQRSRYTAHTPVSAVDAFAAETVGAAIASYALELGVSPAEILILGEPGQRDTEKVSTEGPYTGQFSFTQMALRLSGAANGVSERHGWVSRQLWHDLYPRQTMEGFIEATSVQPGATIPVGYVTNGVHVRSWVAPLIDDLFNRYLGVDWPEHQTRADLWAQVEAIPNEQLWQRHRILKARLVAYVRDRVYQARCDRGDCQDDINAARRLLDPDVLTIGVARRFSDYKRSDLLFYDLQRLIKIVAHPKRPVQIIFAGKANPNSDSGKRIIQRIMEWSSHPDLRDRIAFLENYDLYTSKLMVQGVDLWLTTTHRTLEASGIGGQKVAINGGLNLAIRDGWWYEGYQPGLNGWAIGEAATDTVPVEGYDSQRQTAQNAQDAAALYQLLERDITRLYYQSDSQKAEQVARSEEQLTGEVNYPPGWLRMMKASIRTVVPFFNTHRVVAQYVAQQYFPTSDIAKVPKPILTS